MLTYVIVAAVALVVVLLAIVAVQPSEFRIERRATVPGSAESAYAEVVDLHRWQAWSPWEEVDPNMQRTYSGSPSGTGAVYSWIGNKNVGEGRMTIVDSRPPEFIRIKLEFFKPFKGVNTAEFTFHPVAENQTAVTWAMYGPKNFLAKALHLLCNMERMIGGQFEKGLANLKSLLAKQSGSPAAV